MPKPNENRNNYTWFLFYKRKIQKNECYCYKKSLKYYITVISLYLINKMSLNI